MLYTLFFIIWLGAPSTWVSAKLADGVFRWQSGVELPGNSSMWAPKEPYFYPYCVAMWDYADYYLNDDYCNAVRAVLCEIGP